MGASEVGDIEAYSLGASSLHWQIVHKRMCFLESGMSGIQKSSNQVDLLAWTTATADNRQNALAES